MNAVGINAFAILNEAEAHISAGEYDSALAILNEAIRNQPNEHLYQYYDLRGYAYTKMEDYDRAIADSTQTIRLNPEAGFMDYMHRGMLYSLKHDSDRAIADYDKALGFEKRSSEMLRVTYILRGRAYGERGDIQQALADFNEAIRVSPGDATAYLNRGIAYFWLGQFEPAIKEFDEAIHRDPTIIGCYASRALALMELGRLPEAMADAEAALKLRRSGDPPTDSSFEVRGLVYLDMGKAVEAIDDFNQAIRLSSQSVRAYVGRGEAYEKLGAKAAALADYRKAAQMAAYSPPQRKARLRAIERRAALDAEVAAPAQHKETSAASGAGPGRRIALVIGDGNYKNEPVLPNPPRDAQAMADALRHLGFDDVIELEDLSRARTEEAVKQFGDKAADAAWAVVYFAGHGMQVDGRNFLVPVDAKLGRVAQIEHETVSLDSVMAAAGAARELGLVILDSCRDNPFLNHLMQDGRGKRSLDDGLASVEPARGELVVFATRDGRTASDGSRDPHSPFTSALLQYIDTPGVDIRKLFGRVRDAVLASTGKTQEPWIYGSLPGDELYFKAEGR